MTIPLLTAHDATGHIHLIIGSNPLAAARCTRSVESGARPILFAPAEAHLHYSVLKKIEDNQVQWTKRDFRDEDLQTFGRDEVDNIVDAVFVTLGGKSALSTEYQDLQRFTMLTIHIRYSHFYFMSKTPCSGQCYRCPKSLHLYSSFYPLRWPFADWHHNQWQRM